MEKLTKDEIGKFYWSKVKTQHNNWDCPVMIYEVSDNGVTFRVVVLDELENMTFMLSGREVQFQLLEPCSAERLKNYLLSKGCGMLRFKSLLMEQLEKVIEHQEKDLDVRIKPLLKEKESLEDERLTVQSKLRELL